MTLVFAALAYLAIGAALTTRWYYQSQAPDRPTTNLILRAALLWPVALLKSFRSWLSGGWSWLTKGR